jgi:transporter family protein
MKTALMILLIVLATSAGEVFVAQALKQVGEISTLRPSALLRLGKQVSINRSFLLGSFFIAISFVAFLAVLSWADVSYTVPATSLSFVISTLGARLILKEKINLLRWTGTILVFLGIALISLR